MLLKTKRLPKDASGIMSDTGICLIFEQEEVRYLSAHLQGAQPKFTYQGTIGQGLTVWFEAKGSGLRETSDGLALEGMIEPQRVAGYQGMRQSVSPPYERTTLNGKPAVKLAPIAAYDRDAGKPKPFNPVVEAERLFNPIAPTPKPELTKADIKAIVARHSLGGGQRARGNVVQMSAQAVAPPRQEFTEPPMPSRFSSDNQVAEVKTAVNMINELMPFVGDDIVLGLSDDLKRLTLVRRRVVFEEVGA